MLDAAGAAGEVVLHNQQTACCGHVHATPAARPAPAWAPGRNRQPPGHLPSRARCSPLAASPSRSKTTGGALPASLLQPPAPRRPPPPPTLSRLKSRNFPACQSLLVKLREALTRSSERLRSWPGAVPVARVQRSASAPYCPIVSTGSTTAEGSSDLVHGGKVGRAAARLCNLGKLMSRFRTVPQGSCSSSAPPFTPLPCPHTSPLPRLLLIFRPFSSLTSPCR